MREVLSLASLSRDVLLGWRLIEIDLHSRLQLTVVELAIGLVELFAGHSTMPLRIDWTTVAMRVASSSTTLGRDSSL